MHVLHLKGYTPGILPTLLVSLEELWELVQKSLMQMALESRFSVVISDSYVLQDSASCTIKRIVMQSVTMM